MRGLGVIALVVVLYLLLMEVCAWTMRERSMWDDPEPLDRRRKKRFFFGR